MFLFYLLSFTSLAPRQVLWFKTLDSILLQPAFDHHYNIPNRKLSPSQLKAFPFKMYFLNKFVIYPNHFISTGVKLYFTRKSFEMNDEDSAQKVRKKLFYCTDIYVCNNFVFLFHFFVIWLSVKFKEFFIIKTFFQILHIFVLLYKDKLKVQHESATCPFCTNMLHYLCCTFSRKS